MLQINYCALPKYFFSWFLFIFKVLPIQLIRILFISLLFVASKLSAFFTLLIVELKLIFCISAFLAPWFSLVTLWIFFALNFFEGWYFIDHLHSIQLRYLVSFEIQFVSFYSLILDIYLDCFIERECMEAEDVIVYFVYR